MILLILKKSIPGILLLCLILQNIILSGDLFGLPVISLRKLCTCDHSAQPHSHSKTQDEDLLFSEGVLPGIFPFNTDSKKADTTFPDPNEICGSPNTRIAQTSLSNPHEGHGDNPEEPHFCPHEKAQQVLENTALALNAMIYEGGNQVLFIQNSILYIFHDTKKGLNPGYPDVLLHPPKQVS